IDAQRIGCSAPRRVRRRCGVTVLVVEPAASEISMAELDSALGDANSAPHESPAQSSAASRTPDGELVLRNPSVAPDVARRHRGPRGVADEDLNRSPIWAGQGGQAL